ncbi:MAG: LacI family DNA-binding transcriptional regulator [Planctomycetales bacterium]|nr:LacI family DNA-binding transcriptional regulator [Planctomycetales bacterium]
MQPTIEEIAKRAGVSTSTVARALRGDLKGAQRRSVERALEIRRISEELGYRPSWRARALSKGKTHSIGLLYSDPMWIFEDPMNDIAVALTESLQTLRYDLRLIPVTKDQQWKELVYGGAVDAVVFLTSVPEATREVLASQIVPVVLVGDKSDEVPSIVPDDEAGGYLATRHLLGLGHERIVYFVSDTIRPHYSIEERRTGYERAMREAGLKGQLMVWNCGIAEAMGKLLSRDRPTAMIGYCHVEALGITHGAWSHGLSIPTDLSLVTFNDMAMTRYMTPPLTVISYDAAEMGRIGAQMLAEAIEAKSSVEAVNVVLSETLIARGTTAPPASR